MRHEFDTEWENDAEDKIKDMLFLPEDTAEERGIRTTHAVSQFFLEQKFRMLEAYNWKLLERIRRRNFIKDHNLLEYKKVFIQLYSNLTQLVTSSRTEKGQR